MVWSYLEESQHLPYRPRHSPVRKDLIVNTILCLCSQKSNDNCPEPLNSKVYQHKIPYCGVNQDNRGALGHLTTGVTTPVRQTFNQTVTGIRVFPHLENSLYSREQCGVRQYYRADRVVLPVSYQPRVSKPCDSGSSSGKLLARELDSWLRRRRFRWITGGILGLPNTT